eukprot:3760661-Ditylum_brightwellii.AAC.1
MCVFFGVAQNGAFANDPPPPVADVVVAPVPDHGIDTNQEHHEDEQIDQHDDDNHTVNKTES